MNEKYKGLTKVYREKAKTFTDEELLKELEQLAISVKYHTHSAKDVVALETYAEIIAERNLKTTKDLEDWYKKL